MITITKNIEEAKFITHAGTFHADDCFSTVFLSKMYGDITVARTTEYKDDDKEKLVYDIGLGRFDHHQKGFDKKRPNGIHYCAFGLLWQAYGLDYLKSQNIANPHDVFKVFDYLLVNCIDAFDNGEIDITKDYNVYTIPSLIELYRPKNATEDENKCFLEACSLASHLFDKILENAITKVETIIKIKALSSKISNKILVLDEFIPYEYALFYLNLDVDFVVYPSNRGGYATKCVPVSYKSFTPKISFPSSWGGLRDDALAQVSGLKSAKFCHNKRFLFTALNQEDALKAALICEDMTTK